MASASATCASFRVCVTGESGAGKSCLITRVVSGVYTENMIATIGIDYQSKPVATSHGLAAAINFCDLAGQERFRSVCSSHYRNADAVLVVFDLTTGCAGGGDARYWIDQARQFASETVPILLVANKVDMASTAEARDRGCAMHGIDEVAEALAYSGSIYYVSAKTGFGVDDVVDALCHILESTERYLEVASEVMASSAAARHSHIRDGISGDACRVQDIPTPGHSDALLNIVRGVDGKPRIIKAPQFVKLVGGDPRKEPGSSLVLGPSASQAPSEGSRRASNSGACAC